PTVSAPHVHRSSVSRKQKTTVPIPDVLHRVKGKLIVALRRDPGSPATEVSLEPDHLLALKLICFARGESPQDIADAAHGGAIIQRALAFLEEVGAIRSVAGGKYDLSPLWNALRDAGYKVSNKTSKKTGKVFGVPYPYKELDISVVQECLNRGQRLG